VRAEILRLGGRRGPQLYAQLAEAADAFAHDRERAAVKLLEPLREAIPESPSVRELLGLSLYRLGRYRAAAKELEQYAALSRSVDQHPVRMDCERALGRHRQVEELWEELAAVSPSAELVTEGRIVRAGDLADQGRLDPAIRLLGRRAEAVKRPREHHLRLWYALADLEERAGNIPRARELFGRVERADRAFADVAERLVALR
jgi:tetratricopeptide (TPR) repeat protein